MRIALIAAVVAALVTSPAARAEELRAEVLDPLPGDTSSRATDMNESGSVVGVSHLVGGLSRAVRWDPGSPGKQLDDLGFGAVANAVNNDGLVVGRVKNSADQTEGALWDATGALRVLVVGGAEYVEATGVNDAGLIIGNAVLNRVRHAVVWDQFRVAKLLDPGWANYITDSGWVIGTANGLPARWTDRGELRSFGEAYSTLLGHNEAADVVGRSRGSRGLLWLGDDTVELGAGSEPKDISDAGWAVGRSGKQAVRWKAEEGTTGEVLSEEPSDAVAVNNAGTVGGSVGSWAVTWDASGAMTQLAVPAGALRTVVRGLTENGQLFGEVTVPGGSRAVVWR